jgi:quinol monooxygenase YgiN
VLDALLTSVAFPVRADTLERVWNLTGAATPSTVHQEHVRQILGGAAEILILVRMRALPGRERDLEEAAREFAAATGHLEGARGSFLYRPSDEPQVLALVERFADRRAVARHMASEYFRRFQIAQGPLLAAPPEVTLFEPLSR